MIGWVTYQLLKEDIQYYEVGQLRWLLEYEKHGKEAFVHQLAVIPVLRYTLADCWSTAN
jgi:hypothetical protein